jgi:hypothetical protein
MRTLALILIFSLIFPAQLFADPPPTPPVEHITGLVKGETVPFSGVLLSPAAAAKLFTERDYTFEECKLKLDFNLKKERAKYDLLLKSTQVSLESLQNKYDSIALIKNKEIERLSKIAMNKKEETDFSTLWVTGGILAGIALTLLATYSVKEITN